MTSTCQLSRNGSSKTLEEPFVKVEILRRDCPSRSPHFNPLRPCGRRLSLRCGASTPQADFNPLRPCGRRLFQAFYIPLIRPISIHSARVGGDDRRCANHALANDFNPLHPCGRRQQKKPFFRLLSISITTYFTEKSKRTRCKFSHLGYLFQYSLLILVRTSLYVDV